MKSGPTLLAAMIVAGAILGAGYLGAPEGVAPVLVPAPLVEVRPEAPLPAALASLGDGLLAYADGRGRFFELAGNETGMVVTRVWELVHDPLRFQDEPGSRAAHGFYLDEVGEAQRAATAKLRIDLETGAESLVDGIAASLLDRGDLEGLVDALASSRFATRRAAALALGEAGYVAATRVLIDLLALGEGDKQRAHRALVRLTGEDFVEDVGFSDQSVSARRYREWLSANPSARPYARAP